MKIYKDDLRQELIGGALFENKKYYLDFESASEEEIASEIKSSKLTQFINWQKGNRYATLTIINFIGNIYFFSDTYDVKSQKFLTDLSGAEQFQKILEDIRELSKDIIFTYSSPSFVLRQVNYKDANPSLLLMFNYFKRILLYWGHNINLQSDLQKVMANPNFQYSIKYETDRIEKIKRIDGKTLRAILSENKHYTEVSEAHAALINLPLTQAISQGSSMHYLPSKALMRKKYLSYDTIENRFIKFLIEYIENIAFRLNAISDLPAGVIEEKEQILSFCRSILREPFFRDISPMRLMPLNSTILQSRSGYREILLHFTRSRFGIKHIFEDFEQDSMSIDLKKISDLYEYWVFYKIVKSFLGDQIIIEEQDAVMKDGEVSYGVCFKNEYISIYYNSTESRSRKSAYSVALRPDTTVVVRKDQKVLKFVFDAKYKVKNKDGEDEIERQIKSEDLYKMHTYLDAIEDCVFAVAVYPGSEFSFYERDIKSPIRRTVGSIDSFEGVGAIPLVPEDKTLNDQFDNFMKAIKDKFGFI